MHPHEIATQHVRTEYRAGATCFAPALLRDVRPIERPKLPKSVACTIIAASAWRP
jgi:hypothetical protein